MKVAHLSEPAEERVVFRDGLGVREWHEAGTGDRVEWLHLDPAFASAEHPLRERITRLTKFQHVKFARILGFEPARKARGPIVVSSHVQGNRLIDVLEMAGHGLLDFEPGAALQVTREVLAALAVLHDSRNVTHGALGPERVVLTPQGRVVMVEHVLAQALDRLQLPRHQLWRDWRIATPPAAGAVRFDVRTDLAQCGLLALAALLGRPLDAEEYPHRLRGLLPGVQDRLARTRAGAAAPDVVAWLERLVPVDSRRAFATVREAQQAFEGLVSGAAASLGVAPARLKTVMAAVAALQATTSAVAPEPTPAAAPGSTNEAAALVVAASRRTEPDVPAVSKPIAPEADIDIEALLRLEAELEGGTPVQPVVPVVASPAPPAEASWVDEAPPPGHAEDRDLDELTRERETLERQFAELVAAVAPTPDEAPIRLIPETPAISEPLVDARVRWSSMPADVAPEEEPVQEPARAEAETEATASSDDSTALAIPFEPLVVFVPDEPAPVAAVEHVPADWWKEALPWRAEASSDESQPSQPDDAGRVEDSRAVPVLAVDVSRPADLHAPMVSAEPEGLAAVDLPAASEPAVVDEAGAIEGPAAPADLSDAIVVESLDTMPDTAVAEEGGTFGPPALAEAVTHDVVGDPTIEVEPAVSDQVDPEYPFTSVALVEPPAVEEDPVGDVRPLLAAAPAAEAFDVAIEPVPALEGTAVPETGWEPAETYLSLPVADPDPGTEVENLDATGVDATPAVDVIAATDPIEAIEAVEAIEAIEAVQAIEPLEAIERDPAPDMASPEVDEQESFVDPVPADAAAATLDLPPVVEAPPAVDGALAADGDDVDAGGEFVDASVVPAPEIAFDDERQAPAAVAVDSPIAAAAADAMGVSWFRDARSTLAVQAEGDPSDPDQDERLPMAPRSAFFAADTIAADTVAPDTEVGVVPHGGEAAPDWRATLLAVDALTPVQDSGAPPVDDAGSSFVEDLVASEPLFGGQLSQPETSPQGESYLPVPADEASFDPSAVAVAEPDAPPAVEAAPETDQETTPEPSPQSIPEAVPEVVIVDGGPDGDAWDDLPSESPTAEPAEPPASPAALAEPGPAESSSTDATDDAGVETPDEPGVAEPPATSTAPGPKKKRRRARRRRTVVATPVVDSPGKPDLPLQVVQAMAPSVDLPAPALPAEPVGGEGLTASIPLAAADQPNEASAQDAGPAAPSPQVPAPGPRVRSLLEREVPSWTPPADLDEVRRRAAGLIAAREALATPVAETPDGIEPPAGDVVAVPDAVGAPSVGDPLVFRRGVAQATPPPVEPVLLIEPEIKAVGMPDLEELGVPARGAAVTTMADLVGPGPMAPSRSEGREPGNPVVAVPSVPRRGMNWRRLVAASVLIALFQGAAFAAWWWAQPGAYGTLVVQTREHGVEVLIDGKVIGKTPFREELTPGRHKLVLRQGTQTREMPVEISLGVVTTQALDWPAADGAATGSLQVNSTPAGAEVFVDGQSRGKAPVLLDGLSSGKHTLTLRSDAGTVTVSATVVAGETTPLEVPIFAGWILVDAPVELGLVLNREKIGSSMDGQILLPPGTHRVQAVSEALGFTSTFTVTVEPGEVKRVTVRVPTVPLQVQDDPAADVFVDGDRIGQASGPLRIALGTHDVLVRRPDGSERRQTLIVRQGDGVTF